MNRFVASLSFLIIGISILMYGIDLGLAHVAASSGTSQLTIYNANGESTQMYTGNFGRLAAMSRVDASMLPHGLRRGRSPILVVREVSSSWL